MDRVKRIAFMLLEKDRTLFTTEFEKNKQILTSLATVRSKQLRNEVAGYITSFLKKEAMEKQEPPQELAIAQSRRETV